MKKHGNNSAIANTKINRSWLVLFLLGMLLFFNTSLAQKRPLEPLSYKNWGVIDDQKISNDGKFVCYTISSADQNGRLYVQKTDNSFKQDLGFYKSFFFSEDSRRLIFRNATDSLGVLDLITRESLFIKDVKEVQMPEENSKWLAYKLSSADGELILINLLSAKRETFTNVSDFYFSKDGSTLLLNKKYSDVSKNSLIWCNLKTGASIEIDKGTQMSGFVFDETGSQLAFFAEGAQGREMRLYKKGQTASVFLVSSKSLPVVNFVIGDKKMFFGRKNSSLFFYIQEKLVNNSVPILKEGAKVDVWSYHDNPLYATQTKSQNKGYLSALRLDSNNEIVRLEKFSDEFIRTFSNDKEFSISLIPNKQMKDFYKIHLVSNLDGTRRKISDRTRSTMSFTPSNNFIIWFDQEKKNYLSYDVRNGKTRNITYKISNSICMEKDRSYLDPVGVAGFYQDEESIMIYDNYDIWKIDLNGEKPPVNLTGGNGNKNQIRFRTLSFEGLFKPPLVKEGDTIILSAFNESNKDNGFYRLTLNKTVLSEKCIMNNKIYYFRRRYTPIFSNYADPVAPLKAKFANCYLLYPRSPKDYPNLFVTKNFTDFTALTDLRPQKQFNWYTTELIKYRLKNGTTNEGILFKPEDFDPKKKYPIIFFYYERNADNLNLFEFPDLSVGSLNIPYFVSQGYLVFVPDIKVKLGEPGESAYQSVSSAAAFLCRKPWVNTQKMGIQGHSFGGFETNYVLTRTNVFAAASTSSSMSDLVSSYNSLRGLGGQGVTNHPYYESGQGRIGGTLWASKNLYLKNSPIFFANRVKTPVLIMHNQGDADVHWDQGLGWYLALESLHKKVWMLQYDGENHTLDNPNNQLDFTIRLRQFFDYYLKDKPAPIWMTKGVPVDMKGKANGFELDPGVTP